MSRYSNKNQPGSRSPASLPVNERISEKLVIEDIRKIKKSIAIGISEPNWFVKIIFIVRALQ